MWSATPRTADRVSVQSAVSNWSQARRYRRASATVCNSGPTTVSSFQSLRSHRLGSWRAFDLWFRWWKPFCWPFERFAFCCAHGSRSHRRRSPPVGKDFDRPTHATAVQLGARETVMADVSNDLMAENGLSRSQPHKHKQIMKDFMKCSCE